MNKKFLAFIMFIVPLVFCTSCVEIKEEISFNPDFSGKATYVADFSVSKSDEIMKMVSQMIKPLASSLSPTMISAFNKIDGISGAKSAANKDGTVFSLSFNFSSLTALNSANYRNYFMIYEGGIPEYGYSKSSNKFYRKSISYKKLIADSLASSNPETAQKAQESVDKFDSAMQAMKDSHKQLSSSVEPTIKTVLLFPKAQQIQSNNSGKVDTRKKSIVFSQNLIQALDSPESEHSFTVK